MSNWKDLRNTQETQDKLSFDFYAEAKSQNETKLDPEGNEYVVRVPAIRVSKDNHIDKIEGMYIGTYFNKYSFDTNDATQSIKSTAYFRKANNIAIYKGKQKTDFKGNVADCMNKFPDLKTSANVVILTKEGLYTVKDCVSLTIINHNKIKGQINDNLIIFTPKIFNKKDWEKGMPEKYKELNPAQLPCYLEMTIGAQIDASFEGAVDIASTLKLWNEFKLRAENQVAQNNEVKQNELTQPIKSVVPITSVLDLDNIDETELPF